MGMVDPMNANDMLDYALGQLEGPALEQAERELAADPAPGRDGSTGSAGRSTGCSTTARRSSRPPAWPRRTVAFVAETAGGGGRSSTSCR